jgi:hypothetical protein
MALWGKKDGGSPGAATGTVTFTQTSATVTGSGTAFTTELKVGDMVFLSTANTAPGTTTRYKVAAIANTTSLTLASAYTATTAAGATMWYQQAPRSYNQSYANSSIVNNRDIVGVDVTEARVSANRGRGLKSPGWYNYVAGTGGRSGRKQVEQLVFVKSMTQAVAGDASDDSVAADT